MIKIAICDDNVLHIEHTKRLIVKQLRRYETEIRCFGSSEELLEQVREGFTPDIAVLDIQLGGTDGISLAKELNNVLPKCRIIYLTGYINYAQDVYRTEHIWFVLKEDAAENLPEALAKALEQIKGSGAEDASILVKSDKGSRLISVSDIILLERTGLKSRLVTVDDEYICAKPPQSLLDERVKAQFIRCHQSFWVNLSHVTAIEKDVLLLSNGTKLIVSRTYKNDVRDSFFSRLK